jgi:hypothetical protein
MSKPTITTLCNVEDSDFDENEKKVLMFIQENKLPVTVLGPATDGYFDCEVDSCVTLEAISSYHLTGWDE